MADSADSATIPIVDFRDWGRGSITERRQIAKDLTEACRRVGFVYIVNHGVPDSLLQQSFDWAERLFGLPEEKKMLAPHPPGPSVHRGYSWPGLEKVSQYIHKEGEDADIEDAELRNVPDCKESYEIGSDEFESQPNVWLPEDVLPGFRDFMTAFYWKCFGAGKDVLSALALGLDLDNDQYFLRYHDGHGNQLRLLHYPPIETEKLSTGAAARIGAHSDWGRMRGLQVEHPDKPGTFIDATPVKNAMVVNVGDLLMRWSNDYLKSTLHRVTMPPVDRSRTKATPQATRARYSIPYFVCPNPDAVIECIPQCTGPDNPPKYDTVTQDAYNRMRGKLQYSEK
ncbi:hypothetical protein PG999_007956 [Apiospora kogelbergensis]|uniref:Fe2OG dioxygenase domain-containing protein n=1 Tax=Apiospora kogelbergensis TaxID=1337665 RepID=A0AAW0QNP7_9PEZI